jgi:DNA-binding beta-propeller fold protein YncE
VYVASLNDNTVRRFSPSGQDLGIFASVGLNEPMNLAFDARGNLFVVNNGDNSIVKFSQSGKALGVVVSLLGRGCPTDLVVDRAGDLLVADICYSVVRKFSTTDGERIFASAGLSNPIALALEPSGNLLVANSDNGGVFRNTIHEFSTAGEDLGTFAATGLNFPGDLAFNALGDLLVTNEEQRPGALDYAVQKLASDGADLGAFAVLSVQPRSVLAIPPLHGEPATHCR